MARAYLSRAARSHDRGDYQQAEADFSKAARLDPRSVEAFLGRARVHETLGKHDRARADRKAAAALAKALTLAQSDDEDGDAGSERSSVASSLGMSSSASFSAHGAAVCGLALAEPAEFPRSLRARPQA